MAKDPAFLFYPNDFDAATKFFSDEQTGIYLRLLIAQFQHGRLSEKQVLFISKRYDEDIMAKFSKDESGMYFNERLEHEISRRKSFSESRKNNRLGAKKDVKKKNISKSLVLDMETETETEIKSKNVLLPYGEKFAEKWEEWKKYKLIQHKFKYKSRETENASIAQIVKFAKSNEQMAIDIIDQSIANGWKGFFELKTTNNAAIKPNLAPSGRQAGVSQLLEKTKRDFQSYTGGSAGTDS